jgi:uncharacterized YccA/Bax inhibitor family protein
MRTSNPALQQDTFSGFGYGRTVGDTMTVQGVVLKTCLLLLLVLLSAGFTWTKFYQSGGNPAAVQVWILVGAIGGMILAFVTAFKKEWAGITAPLYALLEGLFIGGISAALEVAYPRIVMQAASLTFGTLFAMLAVYQTGLIPVTDKFKMGVAAATGGIAIVYLVAMVLSFFGIQASFIFGNSLFSIGFSLLVVGIAALNFILDFDVIEQGAKLGAPKYMEWYGAFALMVTLIWLYVEFLRLLSKLRSRD